MRISDWSSDVCSSDLLVSRGLVRYIGVSNWQAWRMAKSLGISEARGYARFETVQAYYSLAGRDLERESVPFLTEEKMGLRVWSPLAGGLLRSAGRRVGTECVNTCRSWW